MRKQESPSHDLGSPLIVNGLALSGNLPNALDAMIDGGITASNLTAAANEGFGGAMLRLERVLQTIANHDRAERLAVITSPDDIRQAHIEGKAGVIIGFQNATPIENELDYLHLFYRLGLRIMQLTYQRRNLLGDGCAEPANSGLSRFGRQVIDECNELGILIDLSHVGHRSTLEAIEASGDPVAVTHANVYSLNPVDRNKTDDVIRALAERDGVFGVSAAARLVSPTGTIEGASLGQFLDHIDYLVDLAGIEHVGIGLDIREGMDEEQFAKRKAGFFAQFPELTMGADLSFENYYVRDLSTAAELANVGHGLLNRGYSIDDMHRVLGGNFVRVLDEVWQAG